MHPTTIGLVLHYRDAARTATCMNSLLLQDVHHILVVDNSADEGQSANSLRLMMNDTGRFSILSPRYNLGFSAGVNLGLEEIVSRFAGSRVLLINNDAVLFPGALDLLSLQLRLNPKAVLVYPTIDHGGWVRGTVYYHRLTGLITDMRLPGSFPYPSGCCMLINPDTAGVKLFDEDFFMYGEDIELGARLAAIPGAMIHVAQVLVQHKGAASSGMATQFYETRIIKAHITLIKKLGRSKVEKLLMLSGKAITLSARALVRCIRYKSIVPLKALYQGLGEM